MLNRSINPNSDLYKPCPDPPEGNRYGPTQADSLEKKMQSSLQAFKIPSELDQPRRVVVFFFSEARQDPSPVEETN